MTLHVSFVIATHNRCDILNVTIDRLLQCELPRNEFEIIVVDNASDDNTAASVAPRCDEFVRLDQNEGSCAKQYGLEIASAPLVVFLDDDSCPWVGSTERMIRYFERQPDLGAAGFTVHLPSGELEGSALPNVFVGCGVGLRKEAVQEVGGLDKSLFMQAEEYDLAFRLVTGGWDVKLFDDLHVDHLKTGHARRSERTTYYDIRNNIVVAARHLPQAQYRVYLADIMRRYGWLAEQEGHREAFVRGSLDGRSVGVRERARGAFHPLTNGLLERFFQWRYIEEQFAKLRIQDVRRVTLADLGKNIYPFVRGARKHEMDITAIGDDRFAGQERTYRGIDIIDLASALEMEADAVVVSNSSGVHGQRTFDHVRSITRLPVYFWRAQSKTSADELPFQGTELCLAGCAADAIAG